MIPARYGSSRFPGKVLARQTGKYLVQHVVDTVRHCAAIERIVVATDDTRVIEACRSFDVQAVMTRADHPSGTDRIAEAIADISAEIIVNVQADEPDLSAESIDTLVALLKSPPKLDVPMATLAAPFPAGSDPTDPNRVKVVLDDDRCALYFSRSLIPFDRVAGGTGSKDAYLLHLGTYAYRREFLLECCKWPPGRLEQIEKLEQLRALEHGAKIAVAIVDDAGSGIDTPEDYKAFVNRHKEGSQAD